MAFRSRRRRLVAVLMTASAMAGGGLGASLTFGEPPAFAFPAAGRGPQVCTALRAAQVAEVIGFPVTATRDRPLTQPFGRVVASGNQCLYSYFDHGFHDIVGVNLFVTDAAGAYAVSFSHTPPSYRRPAPGVGSKSFFAAGIDILYVLDARDFFEVSGIPGLPPTGGFDQAVTLAKELAKAL